MDISAITSFLPTHFYQMAGSVINDPPATDPTGAVQNLLMNITLSTWIGRAGGLIAFVGAIKLALSVKNDDAREQIQAALIMVSGFMIQAAIGNLGIFNMPSGAYSQAASDLEFQSILGFIENWAVRVGGIAMLFGGIMFGLALKESDAGSKVNGLKTLAAGGITVAVSGLLQSMV